MEGEVARAAVGPREPGEEVRGDVELGRQRAAQDELLGPVRHLAPLERLVDELAVRPVHACAGRGVDQQAVDDVREVVAGLAVHRPVGRQVLEGGGDLLDHEVEGTRTAAPGDGRHALLQAAEIPGRVVEAVGVIDAQSVDLALGDQLQEQAVRGLEDRLVLDAQRRQIVDIEEAAVVDILGRDAPGGEVIGLQVEQLVQRIEARGLPCRADEAAHRRLDGAGDRAVGGCERRQAALVQLLLAVALGHLLGSEGVAVGQRRQRATEVLELGVGEERQHAVENARISARIERQAMPLIVRGERAPLRLEAQLELAALEHGAVGCGEHRHQHLVGAVRV